MDEKVENDVAEEISSPLRRESDESRSVPEIVNEEQIEEAQAAKEAGNNYFREKEYELAVESYSRAISLCIGNDKNQESLVMTR
jgi:hypothetical protein